MRSRRVYVAVAIAALTGAYGVVAAAGSAEAVLTPLPAPSAVTTAVPSAPAADGPAPAEVIRSKGPLTAIGIDRDLACSVVHADDEVGEFFVYAACGTFVAVGETVYGPTILGAAGFAPEQWSGRKQARAGDGSRGNPVEIITWAHAGDVQIEEVDSYVVGDDFYSSDITLATSIDETIPAGVFHAAACRIEGTGYGSHSAVTGAITCDPAPDSGTGGGRTPLAQLIPLTAASDYFAGAAADLWAAIGTGLPLPDEVRDADGAASPAMGLSWVVTLAPGQPVVVSFRTSFARIASPATPTPTLTPPQPAPAAPPAQPAPPRAQAISPAADGAPLAWGGAAAAMTLFVGGSVLAAANSPRRRQRRLVRRHVRVEPHHATEMSFPSRTDAGPPSPTFRLEGRAGTWTHRAIEEES